MTNKPSQRSDKNLPDKQDDYADIVMRDDFVDDLMDAASSVYRRLFNSKSAEEPTLIYEDGHVWIGLT